MWDSRGLKVSCGINLWIDYLKKVKAVLLELTDKYSSVTNEKYKVVPGWNDHIKEFHSFARKYLIEWIKNRRPSDGTPLLKMKEARSCFKCALDYCKANEDKKRKEDGK